MEITGRASDLLGRTDSASSDESRLAGEASGVNDIISHPVEPRTLRVQMSMAF